jgi:outer membrane lipoprotein SlyB
MSIILTISRFIFVFFILFFCGCAQQRPVLYPNSHLEYVGSEKAQADIDACLHLAKTYGAGENKGKKIAKDTAAGATVGAVAGAAIGAVLGNNVGRAAGVGAAGAGAATMTRKTIDSGEPDPLFRRFVEKCLHEKGYETIGWQ